MDWLVEFVRSDMFGIALFGVMYTGLFTLMFLMMLRR